MKLFFEAGTVSAADESIAAPRRTHSSSDSSDREPPKRELAAGEPPATPRSIARVMSGVGDASTQEVRVANMPLKPIIMEWDEWQLSFQNEPVVIDYGGEVPDDETTTSDLSSSEVRLHLSAQAGHGEQEEQRRIP